MSIKEYYIAPSLTNNEADKLSLYHYFWNLPGAWVEQPNKRGHGWSGVIKHTMPQPDGKEIVVYVKKQSRYIFRNFKYPLGQPTFRREFSESKRAKHHGVNTPEFLYYAQNKRDAVLVSKSFEDYVDFNTALTLLCPENRIRMIHLLGKNLKNLWQANIHHGNMLPKHILISISNNEAEEVRIIDFEKTKKRIFRSARIFKEINRLFKHVPNLNNEEKKLIISFYEDFLARYYLKKLNAKYVLAQDAPNMGVS